MKTLTIIAITIAAIVLVAVVLAALWLKRKINSMAHGVKFILIMQRLTQFSGELKKQGTFTNDIPKICDITPFTDEITLNGTPHRCTLAAKSPLFDNRGMMAITENDTVVWIDSAGKATPFNGPDSANNDAALEKQISDTPTTAG